jgi:sulfur-oxidizing protein SoxA
MKFNLHRWRFFATGLFAVPLVVGLAVVSNMANAQCVTCTNGEPKQILLDLIDKIDSDYLTQSPQNLQMMDDNPGYFDAEEGQDLFEAERGPNNVSLEQCDFGKGPGVLEGAYAEMPRYFEDAGRVLDLESRIVYCMQTVQGFPSDAPELKKGGQIRLIQAYIGSRSNGYEWQPSMDHPLEKAVRDAGEEMFYRRAGILDFSCNTCHGQTGKRIRASVLPNVNVPEEWTKAVSWPAVRVGPGNTRSTYLRVRGCYWQMRKGRIYPQSDALIAITSFWTDAARGQPAILPDLKR